MQPSERYKFPKELAEIIPTLRLDGAVALQSGRYEDAKEIFEKQYNLIIQEQTKTQRSFHKGDALYNLGLTFLYLKNHEDAIRYFLLAYIEDTLSSDYDNDTNTSFTGSLRPIPTTFASSKDWLKPLSANLSG